MKSAKRSFQRKSQSWLALLVFRASQGPIENKGLTTLLSQICRDLISSKSFSSSVSLSQEQIKINPLRKNYKARQKFIRNLEILKRIQSEKAQPTNNPPTTIGNLVKMWAVLTDQNEDEFILKINPKITRLVVEHYLKTKQLGVTDDYAYEKPELAFDFLADLFNILVEEIFPEKQAIIGEKILRLLSSDSTTIIPDDEVLLEASTLATFDAVTQINERLSAEPLLKERLNQPVLAEILTMEAKAYGWDEVTSSDNIPKLQSTLSQAGYQIDKRTMSRSLKSLARKNPLQTIKDALNDNLMKNLINRISEIKQKADRIETSFEFPSDSEVDNTQVRKWIFRRS